jgi:hypothetical protein
MSSLHTTLDFLYEIWASQVAKQQQHKCSPNSNIFWIRSERITNFYFNNQTIEMTVNCVVVWISFDFNRKIGFLVFYLCRVVIFPYAADLWVLLGSAIEFIFTLDLSPAPSALVFGSCCVSAEI